MRPALLAATLVIVAPASGDPTTRRYEIDFGRAVPSRNLSGLAARSDGRLVHGPSLRALEATLPELVWCLEPDGAGGWLIGSGPDGRVVRATLGGGSASVSDSADFEETNVFAVCATGAGEFLAGAAPGGVLYLVKDGAVVARSPLGADVIWDIRQLSGDDYLVATGSPAKIFKVSLARFRKAGVTAADAGGVPLDSRGINSWAEIRDRNARRLVVAEGGRVIVGSSPRGAIYEFGPGGGQGFILSESKDAEVSDLLVTPDGTLYAALVYNAPAAERRLGPRPPQPPQPAPAAPIAATSAAKVTGWPPQPPQPAPAAPVPAAPSAPPPEFGGRSEVLRIPKDGFPESVVTRNNLAIYKLAAFGDLLLMGGGERGEVLGYNPLRRMFLTFAGAPSSQVNGIAPIRGSPGQFLLLRNNFSGLAVLDFGAAGERTAETHKLELGLPSLLGLLQFSRLRELSGETLSVDFKFGNSADEGDGWSDWRPATREGDAFRLGDTRARYARVRLRVPAAMSTSAEIGRASLFHIPQNRPPVVQDFRVFPPGLGLIPMPEPPAPASLPLGQFLLPNQPQPQQGGAGEQPQKHSFLASQVVAQPGNQLVYWNASDPDGDNLLANLALRNVNSDEWTKIAAGVSSNNLGFSTADLVEGPYVLRLTITEDAPRPEKDRQFAVHDSDDLTVDRSPPELLEISQSATDRSLFIRVAARDTWSLLRGARAIFNNGVEVETVLPEDGILDGREETFVLEIPRVAATGATNAEVMVVDQAGNRTSRRVSIAP